MADFETWTVGEAWLDVHCALGEGPFYEAGTNSLRFVDIKKKRLHSVSLTGGASTLETMQLDIGPSVTSDIEGVDPRDRILVGVKHGLAVLDRRSGRHEMISRFSEPDNERLRANDGAADEQGRFWLGSMTDFGLGEFQPEGSLFCFDGSGGREQVMTGLTIPNSVGWSPDRRTMYFTHSKTREIWAWKHEASAGGATSGKRLFYRHATAGEPDGFRVDEQGNVWSAVYGEGRVIKISGEGRVVGEVRLPTRNITCVEFAGTELLITSAADEAADADARSRALGGAVFRVDVGARGLEPFKFRL